MLSFRGERNQPFKQARSTENNDAKRMWPEVNQSINYPVKRGMSEITKIDNTGIFDVENHSFKFFVSWMMAHITKNTMNHFVNSWTCHRVPGLRGCIPFKNMICEYDLKICFVYHG